jgi:hypothetical protein
VVVVGGTVVVVVGGTVVVVVGGTVVVVVAAVVTVVATVTGVRFTVASGEPSSWRSVSEMPTIITSTAEAAATQAVMRTHSGADL